MSRMNFTERLRRVQQMQRSLLCIGLDVDPLKLPASIRRTANPLLDFNRRIIEATHDLLCAYKLNLAFYEALGAMGWNILERTLALIPSSVLTIGDGKRADIGNTSEQYARALFDHLGFDATTVNPYMGYDSVEPFLRQPGRGVFVLTLTSNPGSRDFQRARVGKHALYERVALRASRWNQNQNIGLVVGATHATELKRVRVLAPPLPILIPGIGAQGGDLQRAVRYGCTTRGDLAILTVSRTILYASSGKDFAEAARRQAEEFYRQIQQARKILSSVESPISPSSKASP